MDNLNNTIMDILRRATQEFTLPEAAAKKNNAECSDFRKMLSERKAGNESLKSEAPKEETGLSDKGEVMVSEASEGDDVSELQMQAAAMLLADIRSYLTAGESSAEPELMIAAVDAGENPLMSEITEAGGTEELIAAAGSGEAQEGLTEIPEAITKTEEAAENTAAETKSDKGEIPEAGNKSEKSEDEPEINTEAPVFRDLKDVPFKVGEVQRSAKNQAAESPKEQVFNQLKTAIANGDTKVEINLKPEALGRVDIEMVWSKDGGLQVTMVAEKKSTQNMLENNISELSRLLGRSGEQEIRIEVTRNEDSQRQNFGEGHGDNPNNGRGQSGEHHEHRHSGQDFMHKLRLGLTGEGKEAS